MYLISAEGYKNGRVNFLRVQKTSEIWASMKDIGTGMNVKNTSDLVLKQKTLQKYKLTNIMTEREIYEKFDNLSKEELNTKWNKDVYLKNVVMTAIIKRCRGEKKRGVKAVDGFRKK